MLPGLLLLILQLTSQTMQQPVNRTSSWRALYHKLQCLVKKKCSARGACELSRDEFQRVSGESITVCTENPTGTTDLKKEGSAYFNNWSSPNLPTGSSSLLRSSLGHWKKNCPRGRFHEGENLVRCVPCDVCPTDAHFGETRDPHCWGLLGISVLNLRVKARDEMILGFLYIKSLWSHCLN